MANRTSYIFIVERQGKYAVRMRIDHLDSLEYTQNKLEKQGWRIVETYDNTTKHDDLYDWLTEILLNVKESNAIEAITRKLVKVAAAQASREALTEAMSIIRERSHTFAQDQEDISYDFVKSLEQENSDAERCAV